MNDLAKAARLARQALQRIAAGERPATMATATKLASALETWARICTREAKGLRNSLTTPGTR